MHSFDIFDTLITRKVAVPEGIFAIMQFELGKEEYIDIPISIKNNFYRLRIEAERQARHFYQRNGIEDVTLEQIYDVLAVRGELSEGQCKQLVCLECDIEYRECIPIERNIIQVKKLLSEGKKVILISDMYLPKEQIYKYLEIVKKENEQEQFINLRWSTLAFWLRNVFILEIMRKWMWKRQRK